MVLAIEPSPTTHSGLAPQPRKHAKDPRVLSWHGLTLPGLGTLPASVAEGILARVQARAPEFLPTCRQLLLGPHWTRALFGGPALQPSTQEFDRLLRWFQDDAPDLLAAGQLLIYTSPQGKGAVLELMVDQLYAATGWEHPAQVLGNLPDLNLLLDACRNRGARLRGPRRKANEILKKVERAARIAEEARRERERLSEL